MQCLARQQLQYNLSQSRTELVRGWLGARQALPCPELVKGKFDARQRIWRNCLLVLGKFDIWKHLTQEGFMIRVLLIIRFDELHFFVWMNGMAYLPKHVGEQKFVLGSLPLNRYYYCLYITFKIERNEPNIKY